MRRGPPIRSTRSLTPENIVCLEYGKKFKIAETALGTARSAPLPTLRSYAACSAACASRRMRSTIERKPVERCGVKF